MKNGYSLTRRWFNFSFEKKEAGVYHTALFVWIIELNNRLGWKQEFGLPTSETMEGLSIGNKSTYHATLKDLEAWGFIKIIRLSKNQFQSCIISVSRYESEPPQRSALDTALIQQGGQHGNGIDTGIVPIVKPINKETKKPIEERKAEFLVLLNNTFTTEHPKRVDAFFQYWSEYSEGAKKMRFEKQEAFDLARRMGTWKSREKENLYGAAPITVDYTPQMVR